MLFVIIEAYLCLTQKYIVLFAIARFDTFYLNEIQLKLIKPSQAISRVRCT
jgi:hypothetical protein